MVQTFCIVRMSAVCDWWIGWCVDNDKTGTTDRQRYDRTLFVVEICNDV